MEKEEQKKLIIESMRLGEETLEEAGARCFDEMMALNPKGSVKHFIRMAVNFGAKWQAERMYTRDQMFLFAGFVQGKRYSNPEMDLTEIMEEWEKIFKNKQS